MIHSLRDYREERDWRRPWSDAPGWFPCGCCGATTDGYWLGGFNVSFAVSDTTQGIVFSTETCSALATAVLSAVRFQFNGVSDSVSKGFTGGGYASNGAGGQTAVSDKVTFSNDTTAAAATANLSTVRGEAAGVSERDTKGYFLGGDTGVGQVVVATTDKLVYATDTTSAEAGANLSQARTSACGVTDGSTKGYITGGTTGASVRVVTADLLTFSSDSTAAQTSANLTNATSEHAGVSDGTAKAFVAGGHSSAETEKAYRLQFSDDTESAVTTANLSSARNGPGAMSSGSVNGYFNGGITGITVTATSDRLVYSTETTSANATSDLTTGKAEHAAFSKTGL